MEEFGKVTILWVKGHDKNENNIRADYLAGIACGRLKA
jgi:ribonuclease HI